MIIHNVIFPDTRLPKDDLLYFRLSGGAFFDVDNRKIVLPKASKVKFDTFYNSLTIKRWRDDVDIKDLSLELRGTGKFVLNFGLHQIDCSTVIHSTIVNLTIEGQDIPVPDWLDLSLGVLYFELLSVDHESEFLGASWNTSDLPLRNPRLGIVITHFNRKNYVVPAIQRICESINSYDLSTGKIDLIVVDNSQNITDDESHCSTVIPNDNYGGSGGFTRGLLHLEKNDYTHCLFMDDDASCEIESIYRSYVLLSYAKDEKLAVAGSLLREVEPYRLFEKGAQFDGNCHPLKGGLDMRKARDLVAAEIDDKSIDYGGWWFFAFSLSNAKQVAFPFFVRGDDIMFSMVNDFNIITSNGIGCWGDDFGLKCGPLPNYLDTRNHIVQHMTHLDSSFSSTAKTIVKYFLIPALSHNYDTARAVIEAVRDVMAGPDFWVDNIDAGKIRAKIKALSPGEVMSPISRSEYNVEYGTPVESIIRKLYRIISLNGLLLPSFLLKNSTIFQHKDFRANFREIFLYRRVLFEYEPKGIGYVATMNRKIFFSLCVDFVKVLFDFSMKYKKIQRSYNYNLEYLTSRGFWNDVYSEGDE